MSKKISRKSPNLIGNWQNREKRPKTKQYGNSEKTKNSSRPQARNHSDLTHQGF